MIDPTVATETRRRLLAAARRLASLEHPCGYRRTHEGDTLLREAIAMVREVLAKLTDGAGR